MAEQISWSTKQLLGWRNENLILTELCCINQEISQPRNLFGHILNGDLVDSTEFFFNVIK